MSKDLTKYTFKTIYSNQKDVESFYSNALNNASLYKRVSAYFSLGIFSYLKKGLVDFLNNDGYMQLIISIDVSPDIIKIINNSYLQKQEKQLDLLSKKEIIEQLKEIINQEDSDIFGFLIAIGKLDIKLVYKLNGIVHDKFGIISDSTHSLVYIGSNNFTEQATKSNDEAFQVTIDWDEPSKRELETINELNKLFDDLWNNKKNDVITLDLPDPVINKMIENINYDKIEKIVKNTKFVRVDLNNIDELILTSNMDLSDILTYKNIGEYSSKDFLIKEEKCYHLININRVTEKNDFIQLLKSILIKKNINLYYTKKAHDYFSLNLRTYNELSIKGQFIKNDNFISSEDFNFKKIKINSCLNRPLKDKQIQAANHIIELKRSLNFSVPGSGKTATVLGAFEYLSSLNIGDENKVDKLVIIGPINCAKSWKDEYSIVSKYSNDHIPLCLITNDSINDKKEILLHDYETSRIIIINYELLPKIEDELSELLDRKTMVVFDEIHRIKKIDSPKYNSLKKIIKKTNYRIALAGTPLPNGYIDLYNMISLLHDDYTQDYFKMYESKLKTYDSIYKKTGLQNDELNKLLFPFYIRINKKDLNVPIAEPDHLIDVQTNEYEKNLYHSIIKNSYSSFESTIKLIEIGCVPFKCNQIINKDNFNLITIDDTKIILTSKICKFLSVIKKNNNKCVVWCVFIDTIILIENILRKEGYKVKSIYGNTPEYERNKAIDEFNYGELQIIITNPATLAESVSLHKACHEAHYLELNYNLYQYLQSRDRIHRLGLKESDKTNYYIYINYYDNEHRESKDIEIYNRLKKKEELMKKSIDKGNFIFDNFSDFE